MARQRANNRKPRARVPPPLMRWRLPSGRGATEQPNTRPVAKVALTPLFWALVVATGIATGLFGDLMMYILFHVERLSYAYSHGSFEAAVERASKARRVEVLATAGAITGVAWYLLRRLTPGRKADLDDSVWSGSGELSFRRGFISSMISEVAVGAGGSIGREAAPKLMGGISGSVLGRWARLTPEQRTLLVACGGGAGMGAVYNVPLGGALITAELLYGSLSLEVVVPALLCSAVATATSWIYLPIHPTYEDVPAYHVTATEMVWSLLVGPVVALIAVAYIRLVGWVSHHRLSGTRAAFGPLVGFSIVGVVGFAYPQLFGNGKDMAHDVFLGEGTVGLLLALFALKPIVTSICLGSGATGGLFTPTLSTGAVLGGGLGLAWSHLWPGSPVGSYALVGAAAMLGAGTQAPISSLVLVIELTGTADSVMVPMIVATAVATFIARRIDGYSIYSARLPAEEVPFDPGGDVALSDNGGESAISDHGGDGAPGGQADSAARPPA
jgi:CIC family chloride channel protein